MTAIQESQTPQQLARPVTRATARSGQRVLVQLIPGKIHPVTRNDRFGGKLISWGPRGMAVRSVVSGLVVYTTHDMIESVLPMD